MESFGSLAIAIGTRLNANGLTLVRDGIGLLGLAAIATGVGMIYLPAGIIVGGIEMVAVTVLLSRAAGG